MPSTTASAPPKKNKGGRPRKTPSGPRGVADITWKIISNPPGSINHYEISSRGEVRRKLKDGRFSPVKPWVTGGPYAAVYLYGFRGATRNRKKCYIHRLVAEHFVKGRKPGEVVHHKQGPANNSASALAWVSVEENAKASKYFMPDGTRKSRSRRPKVKDSVPRPNALKNKAAKPAPETIKPPVPKIAVKKPAQKAEPKAPAPKAPPAPIKLPGSRDKFPDHDEFIENVETLRKRIRYVISKSPEVSKLYFDTKDVHPRLGSKNLAELFRKATGKILKLDPKRSPHHWKTVLISALHQIKRSLES